MKLFAVFLVALSTTFVNADEYEKIQSVLTDDQPEVNIFFKRFLFAY